MEAQPGTGQTVVMAVLGMSAGSMGRCLLGDHVQWRCPAAGRGPDDAKVQHSVKLMAGNLELFGR